MYLDVYSDPVGRSITAAVRDAIGAEMYRFDASDQMPFDVTFGFLHSALTDYLSNPGASASNALASVEAAWIDYEANPSGG